MSSRHVRASLSAYSSALLLRPTDAGLLAAANGGVTLPKQAAFVINLQNVPQDDDFAILRHEPTHAMVHEIMGPVTRGDRVGRGWWSASAPADSSWAFDRADSAGQNLVRLLGFSICNASHGHLSVDKPPLAVGFDSLSAHRILRACLGERPLDAAGAFGFSYERLSRSSPTAAAAAVESTDDRGRRRRIDSSHDQPRRKEQLPQNDRSYK